MVFDYCHFVSKEVQLKHQYNGINYSKYSTSKDTNFNVNNDVLNILVNKLRKLT